MERWNGGGLEYRKERGKPLFFFGFLIVKIFTIRSEIGQKRSDLSKKEGKQLKLLIAPCILIIHLNSPLVKG